MPDVTGGAIKVIATTVLLGAALVAPTAHAHAQAAQTPAVSARAGALTPDATAIEYGLRGVQPHSATAVP
ncbi:hypothetical protein ACFYZ9_18570 [Streptomyces sp. NPDC001691]|uniref:hypothetical protein n=1 Tax=Streptomyces sp. NPDC001691 TaxID=3364600 RepID=UPI00368B0520